MATFIDAFIQKEKVGDRWFSSRSTRLLFIFFIFFFFTCMQIARPSTALNQDASIAGTIMLLRVDTVTGHRQCER